MAATLFHYQTEKLDLLSCDNFYHLLFNKWFNYKNWGEKLKDYFFSSFVQFKRKMFEFMTFGFNKHFKILNRILVTLRDQSYLLAQFKYKYFTYKTPLIDLYNLFHKSPVHLIHTCNTKYFFIKILVVHAMGTSYHYWRSVDFSLKTI